MSSDAESRTGAGVLAKVQNVNKKIVAVVLAVAMVIGLVIPSLIIFTNHVKAANANQIKKREVGELVTKKTVSPTSNPNVFDVQLESYMTSEAIDYKPTDIILVLDISGSMNDQLSTSQYENLYTHTVLQEYKLNTNVFDNLLFPKVIWHDLFDSDNQNNSGTLPVVGDYTARFRNNKYIEDPNSPGNYVYLAGRYTYEFDHWDLIVPIYHQTYQLFFTDSYGNQYESEKYHDLIAFSDAVESITFKLSENGRVSPPDVPIQTDPFVIRSVYKRVDNMNQNSSLNSTLAQKNNLYIYDDNGEPCLVTLDVNVGNNSAGKYTYTFTDSNGVTHTSVQGNMEYGAGYGLFQGFKKYRYVTDEQGNPVKDADGKFILEAILPGDEDATDGYSVQSKSLYTKRNSQNYSVSRLLTMKESVEQFIFNVHRNAFYRDMDQRIGVVVYSGNSRVLIPLTDVRDEVKTDAIIDAVYGLEANGATRIDSGMNTAKTMLGARTGAERNRESVVIAFTDGVPSSSSDYNTDVADDAIEYSRDMVRDYGTTVYSVGLFELADSEQMHGPMFYHSGLSSRNQICDGSVGSNWGRTWLSQFVNSDMSDIDAAATNRFLNLLSSNYESASSVGLHKYRNWVPWEFAVIRGGEGYRIDNNYEKTGSGYYFGANSSDDLYDAFQKIAEEVAVPESTLGPETVLTDIIADSFKLVSSTPVEAYTMSYIGSGNSESDWDNENNWTSDPNSDRTLNVTTNGNTLSIGGNENTGFDYSSNYVNGQEVNDAGNHGKKTVLKFQIETIENFVGGNQVPTNGDESGVYDSDGVLVEDFVVPYKDIPLDYSIEVADQQIYYTQEADLTQLFTVPQFLDGKTNGYSSINYVVKDPDNNTVFEFFIPAGEDGSNGLYSLSGEDILAMFPDDLKENTTYTVQCVIEPIYEGEVDPDSSRTGNGTVYVYKPVFYEKDDEVSLAQGRAGVNLQPTVVWQLDDTTAPSNPNGQTETYYIKTDGSLVSTSNYQGDYSDLKYTLDNNDDPVYTTIDATLPCTTTKGTVGNNEAWISTRQGAPNITSAINNTDETPAVKASPFNQYVMEETTNFQVVDVTIQKESNEYETPITTDIVYYVRDSDGALIKASTYTGNFSELRKAVDGEGNPISYEEDGQTVYVYETVSVNETVTRPRADVRDDDQTLGSYTTYINTTSQPKTTANEGRFTISIKPVFDLVITKNFAGDYVNPEDVTIVVTPQGDATNAQSITFTATGFTRNGAVFTATDNSITDLDSNQKYVISEVYAQGSQHANLFETSFTVTSDNETYVDDDTTDGYQFTLDKGLDEDTVTVVITNTLPDPTIEGIDSGTNVPHVLLYILAGVIVLAGGAGSVYVYKKKDEFIAE